MARCENRSYIFLIFAIIITGFGMYIFKVGRNCRDSQDKIQINDDGAKARSKFGKNFPMGT